MTGHKLPVKRYRKEKTGTGSYGLHIDEDDLPAQNLVRDAMRVLGVTTASQLADELGMTKRNQDRTVRRWIDGETQPNYGSTLKLLTIVGRLREDEATGEARPAQPTAMTAGDLTPALRQIGDGLATLEALVSGRSQQEQRHPGKRNGRRKTG